MHVNRLIRRATLPSTAREGQIAYDSTNDRPVVGNGTSFVPLTLFDVTVRQAASPADECFFIANRACKVIAIRQVHSTAGSDGLAVNLQVTKDTSTNAPGAGTDLLTNNTNAGFDLKGTANTVQTGTLTSTAASLLLAAGDRLSLDYAGTLTAVAGVVVTVTLEYVA